MVKWKKVTAVIWWGGCAQSARASTLPFRLIQPRSTAAPPLSPLAVGLVPASAPRLDLVTFHSSPALLIPFLNTSSFSTLVTPFRALIFLLPLPKASLTRCPKRNRPRCSRATTAKPKPHRPSGHQPP